ncbi:MAG: hypothetical protein NVV68_00950 [Dokdonella sp.]|jgi:hypothetical protein|nr:hypothetical protein [Dokdonella sp.]
MFARPSPSPTTFRPRAVWFVTLLTTGIAASTAFAQPAALKPDALPIAETVSITALPRPSDQGHNARLDVRYEKGQRLPERIELQVQDRPVYLQRDPRDPDAYAGTIPFDFDRFVAEQARRKSLAAQGKAPVFHGREIVDHRPVAFLDPATLTRQIGAGTPIRIPKDVVTGTAGLLSAERSLMVVHPLVVEDPTRTFDACTNAGNPTGVWTFAHLMSEMANQPLTGIDPADFVEDWLKSWVNTAFVNSFEITERDLIINSVINPWPRDGSGRLKLEQSPMRLLAIVNRVDLRKNAVYGGGSAGEGRFVFGIMRRLPGGGCALMRSTVILEYGVPIRGCTAVQDYGTQWHALDGLPLGSPAYNAALEDITVQFTKANAAPGKPNGSAINQIRTNENALDPLWELREFGLDGSSHLLVLKSTEMTPHRPTYNPFPAPHTTTLLADFINTNEAAILAGTYTVPDTFLGQPFLTGSSLNPSTSPSFVWKHPGVSNNEARHLFSLNTCDSCHGGETGTTTFLHVEPRSMGSQAGLSRFLTGSPGSVASPGTFTMPDPVSGVPRTFGDLLHREADLDALVSMSCPSGGLVGGLFATVSAAKTH